MSDLFKKQYLEALYNYGMKEEQMVKSLFNHCKMIKEPQSLEQCADDVFNFLCAKQINEGAC